MRPRQNIQLARIFGIRVGVSMSWFVFLFILIYWLAHEYFPEVVAGSSTTDYVVAVLAALAYFASLILHELGHALAARRLGIPIAGIDLWFFGGLSQMRREPQSPAEELTVAAAGPAVTLALCGLCVAAVELFSNGSFVDAAFPTAARSASPGFALLGWIGFINAMLFVFNIVPAFPLDGGRIARAIVWWRTGDRNRATQATGRSGQAFALALGLFGLWAFANGSFVGLLTLLLAFFLFQAAGAAVMQGALARRIKDITVADIMDREPVIVPAETSCSTSRSSSSCATGGRGSPLSTRHGTSSGSCASSVSRAKSRPDGRRCRRRTCSRRTCPCESAKRRRWNRCSAPRASAAWGRWWPSTAKVS